MWPFRAHTRMVDSSCTLSGSHSLWYERHSPSLVALSHTMAVVVQRKSEKGDRGRRKIASKMHSRQRPIRNNFYLLTGSISRARAQRSTPLACSAIISASSRFWPADTLVHLVSICTCAIQKTKSVKRMPMTDSIPQIPSLNQPSPHS
jgi:hypothetical protein